MHSFQNAPAAPSWLAKAAILAALVLLSSKGWAQTSDEQFDFSIAKQSLTDALVEFSLVTGRQVVADAELLEDKLSTDVNGRLAANEALTEMLQGTGLSVRVVNGRNYALRVAEASRPPQSVAGTRVEQILVLGEKIPRTFDETTSSVALLTSQEIEDANVRSVADALQQIPNVSIGDLGGPVVRGIDFHGVNADFIRPTGSVIVDGVQLPIATIFSLATGNGGSMWDIGRIEVFRGPQSTSVGPNALAGIVLLRTIDPTFEWWGGAQLTFGERGLRQYSGAIAGPIAEDTLAFRLSLDTIESDGTVTNTFFDDDEWARTERQTYRGKLLFTPQGVPGLSALLSVTHMRQDDGADTVEGPDFFERENAFQILEEDTADITFGSLELGYEFSDEWTFTSITSALEEDRDLLEDVSFFVPFGAAGLDLDTEYSTRSQELRFNYSGASFKATFGAFYWRLRRESFFFLEGAPFILPGRQLYEVENFAVFGEGDYEFSPGWTLIAGARVDRDDFEVATSGFTAPEPFSANSGRTVFLPKLGVVRALNDRTHIGFTIQRGYRAGGLGSANLVRPNEFGPEYTWNYELSLRARSDDDRLRATTNVFYTDWTDQQVNIGVFPEQDTVNAGESTLYGAEGSIDFSPIPSVDLSAGVGYVHTEFDEFVSDGTDFAGNRFPYAPGFTANAGVTYRGAAGWFASSNVVYRSSAYTNLANTPERKLESYTLVNARVGYEAERWSVHAYLRNAFDENYVLDKQRLDRWVLGDPREVGMSFNLRL